MRTDGQSPPSDVSAPVVACTTLTKTYRSGSVEVVALADVTLEFPRGQMTAVMGPSGSGKSTLLHCLAGLERPTSGSVSIAGRDLSTLDDGRLSHLRRTEIGFVFQAFNLVPSLTARANIELPLRLAGKTPPVDWIEEILGMTKLTDRLDHRPSELSGGQQQRVAIARALSTRPSVIFADEPTGNLDSSAGTEVLGFLRDSVDRFGQVIIMVTHDPVAASVADRVIFLSDGRMAGELNDVHVETILDRMRRLGG